MSAESGDESHKFVVIWPFSSLNLHKISWEISRLVAQLGVLRPRIGGSHPAYVYVRWPKKVRGRCSKAVLSTSRYLWHGSPYDGSRREAHSFDSHFRIMGYCMKWKIELFSFFMNSVNLWCQDSFFPCDPCAQLRQLSVIWLGHIELGFMSS